MMRKLLACLIIYIFSQGAIAQVTENFNDGDFSSNPVWGGNTADFTVNGTSQLQSNNTTANSTFYLSTPSTNALTSQWEFFTQMAFNPSSVNYVDVFLTASASDLTITTTTGYFVRLGGTDDEISLFRKDGATSTKIIDGADGSISSSNNSVKIKVIRTATNEWRLSREVNGAGSVSEGTVVDATFTTSTSFGILVRQSTASFFQKHFFDDIIVGNYVPDIIAPLIQTLTATTVSTLDVLFDEPVQPGSAETVSNYVVSNGVGSPTSATVDLANGALVRLVFGTAFPVNTNLTLTINGVADLSANVATNLSGTFSFFRPQQYDLVIDELMPDPDPQVGLPNVEWLEIKNTSAFSINMQGWTVGKLSGQSGPMPSVVLEPDSFLIVVTGSALTSMLPFGRTVSVTSFPSLSNGGDLINLRSPDGTTIHTVNYSDSWYKNELKKEGGWSLEMIDTENPCTGFANWKASEDPSGGTPGRRNSVNATNPDVIAPKLLRAYATDSVNITLVFDEAISAFSAAVPLNFTISDGIGTPSSSVALPPAFDRVNLVLVTPIQRNIVYTVTVNGLSDCVGNTIGVSNTARVGLAENADSLDIVINEILFNPKPESNDYVELYNRSNKILNLKNIYIANRNTAGQVSSITQLSTEDYPLFPKEFIVLTASKSLVLGSYIANNLSAFIELSLPSYNDDAGNVIVLNAQGNVLDQVSYVDDWHFKLIADEEGVALERIDFDGPSQKAENWHSAASNIGYGTPTYKNSQYRVDAGVQGQVSIDPAIFSPDNDGRDDFATINYSFSEPGYVVNITIFDAVGRPVRYLQRNALAGIKGYFRWDGLNDKNQKLPVGIYVIYTEVFNLQAKTKKFKNTAVLAKKQ